MSGTTKHQNWFIYLIRCGDNTLYCGITVDIEARLEQHRSGKGARYTRGRGPLTLVYTEPAENKSAALRRECEIKKFRREQKEKLITEK